MIFAAMRSAATAFAVSAGMLGTTLLPVAMAPVPVAENGEKSKGTAPSDEKAATSSKDDEASPALTVRITEQAELLTPGDPVVYRIALRNDGETEYPLAVLNQLLPEWLDFKSAKPKPEATESGRLRWTVTLPPGDELTLTVRGVVADTMPTEVWRPFGGSDGGTLFATTACVAGDSSGQVLDCATAQDRVTPNIPWWATWYALAGYGLLAAALIVGGFLLWRRRSSGTNGTTPGATVPAS